MIWARCARMVLSLNLCASVSLWFNSDEDLMRFGNVPVDEAEGCVLAHSLMVAGRKWPKGRRLSADDLAALRAEGVGEVLAARLEPGDLDEDAAAARLAEAAAGPGVEARRPFTGRANIHAAAAGLLLVDAEAVNAANRVSEAVTLATLPPHEPVKAGQMVATAKIIPFAVPETVLARAVAEVEGRGALRVAPWRPFRAGLVQTRVPATKDSVLDKTVAVTRARLEACGGSLIHEMRTAHTPDAVAQALAALAAAGAEMFLLVGASAITDRGDVLPSAVERVGGGVAHFGMPVDPGNLLMLAWWHGRPVLGMPGCVRSPKLNGADWVLWRLAAGLEVRPEDIMGMGVGGLVDEVPERPMPRGRRE